MKLRKLISVSITMLLVISLTGCQLIAKEDGEDPLLSVYDNSDGSAVKEMETSDALKDFDPSKLESGKFYVRHLNNQCDELYMGNATFEGTTAVPQDNRVIWFRDDFENIPTLYPKETLILYSTEAFDETFNIERFEDFGYSVGIQGVEISKTGRLNIPTKVSDKATYPMSDTDVLLNSTNDYVVVDKVSGQEVREKEFLEGGELRFINRCGVFTLGTEAQPGVVYDFTIYDGTIRHEYSFNSDVRVMGSYEVKLNTDYRYEVKDVITINLPANLHSGYYMVNGAGVFRYINNYDSGIPLEEVNYNIPNTDLISSGEMSGVEGDGMSRINDDLNKLATDDSTDSNSSKTSASSSSSTGSVNAAAQDIKSTFSLTTSGNIKVKVTFTTPENVKQSNDEIRGTITTPSGTSFIMSNKSDGSLELDLDGAEKGSYTIEYKNLNGRKPHVSVT